VSSSPHHHKANGKVESAVKIAKSLIKKSLKDNKDPWLALLDQRNTPTESIGTSPAQRLMSRRTRTLLLRATNLLYPKVPESVTEKLKLKRQKAKWYHDRSSRSLPEIEIGQDIRVAPLQRKLTWKTGTCIEKLSDRSYVVKTNSDNLVLRKNQELLTPAEQPAAQTQPIVVTESPPAKCDVQTPVPEQKQMSTPSRLPAVKKTCTRVVKFKDFFA